MNHKPSRFRSPSVALALVLSACGVAGPGGENPGGAATGAGGTDGAFSNVGALPAATPSGALAAVVLPPKVPRDFNGDRKSDVLWQNGTDLYAWFMNGSTYTFSYLGGPPSPWVVVGTGDFDGDGNTDVLWRNGSDMYIWFMHGSTPFTFAYVACPPAPWEVAAVADFDGDGKADIFWRNGTDGYVWFMTGATFTWAYIAPPPAPWAVSAVGDFNGDGKADILWRNGTDGYVWFMNGGTFTWSYFATPAIPWASSGVGDFNGDGTSDILWKNGSDMYIWYMHGALPVTSDYVAGLGSPWQLVLVGDLDGDGKADLLWRDGANLQTWFMNGAVHANGFLSGPPAPWTIVGQVACAATQACSPAGPADPCKVYATACDAAGTQTCAPSANVADGTTCGAGLVCTAGTCGVPLPPGPAITGVSPASGPITGGVQVTITGANFVNGGTVTFGGVPGTIVGQVLSNQIVATTPINQPAGTVDVAFQNPVTFQVGTLKAAYTFVAPAPTIDALSVRGAPVTGGTTVTITGTGLQPGVTATFAGAPATGLVLTDSTPPRKLLTVTVPPQPAGAGSLVDLVVRNPDGQSATFTGFHYGPPPVVTGVSVAAPATLTTVHKGDIITITGVDFSAGAGLQVQIGQLAVISSATTTQVVVVAPKNNPGTYQVVVTNGDGQFGIGPSGTTIVYPGP